MSHPTGSLFGAQGPAGGGGFSFTPRPPSPAGSSYSFAAAPATAPGASATTAAGASTGGFTFGGSGFKGGTPATSAGMPGGFSFGAQPSATSGAAPAATTGFGLGGTPATSAGMPGGFSFATQPSATSGAAPAATTGFGLGGAPATSASMTGGFSFGAQPSATSGAAPALFGLGASTKPAGRVGLGLQQPVAAVAPNTTAAAPAGGFGLGASSKLAGRGFSFTSATSAITGGTPGGTTAPSSSLGLGATPAQAQALGSSATTAATTRSDPRSFPQFSLGPGGSAPLHLGAMPTTDVATTAGQGISIGGKPAPSATALGTGTVTKSLGFATTTSAGGGFSLGAAGKQPEGLGTLLGKPTTTAPTSAQGTGLSLQIPSATSTAAPAKSTAGLTLGGGFSLGAAGKQPEGLGTLLGKPTTTVPTSAQGTGLAPRELGSTTAAAKPVATTGAAAAAAAAPTTHSTTISYHQLEQNINKWTVQLEGQEKIFLHQATQVNAWDRILMENGDKITLLHSDVEKVKTDQQRLEHELDFIMAQQRELEDMLVPLEEGVRNQQQGTVYSQHADLERERTYQLAENIDGQLQRMVQDLKEIIEHLNTANAPQDTSGPITQIGKILNAHMDSLQWIDQNTVMLQRKVDEVTKQSEIVRRDQEKNVHLAFD